MGLTKKIIIKIDAEILNSKKRTEKHDKNLEEESTTCTLQLCREKAFSV